MKTNKAKAPRLRCNRGCNAGFKTQIAADKLPVWICNQCGDWKSSIIVNTVLRTRIRKDEDVEEYISRALLEK